jgi:hypothetical protein
MNVATGYLWPTDDQMLLLRAALTDGPVAREAYDRWCDAVDLSGPVDPGSLGLLPLVHRNIAGDGTEIRHAGLVAGVRRRGFVESHRAIAAAGQAVAALASAGIPVMVIKGVPLALDYYDEPGLRPMSDADLLVPSDRAAPALGALEAAGWRPANGFDARRRRHLLLSHAIELSKGNGADVDLHWQPGHEDMPREAERRLWDRALPIVVSGVEALRPDPTAMLMQVLLHGLRRNFKAPLRWIPDAATILRRDAGRIDWDWLMSVSREGRTFYRLSLALRFLAEHFAVDVPALVMVEAMAARPSFVERLENRFILETRAGSVSTNSYKAAILLRMLMGKRRAAVPDLLWREVLRHVGSARG